MKYQHCYVNLTQTDWKKLRQQKRLVANLFIPDDDETGIRLQEGLLSFLDYIQDEAANQIGKNRVFGKD